MQGIGTGASLFFVSLFLFGRAKTANPPFELLVLNYDSAKAPADPQYEETLCKVAYPPGMGPLSKGFPANPRPVFIALRGGNSNLTAGSVFGYDHYAVMLEGGIVVVEPNYAVVDPDEDYHVAVEGVKLLVQYLRANREELNLDPHKVFLFGRSFGGYVALGVALTADAQVPFGAGPVAQSSSRPNYALIGSAPTDLSCLDPYASGFGLLDVLYFPGLPFSAGTPEMKEEASPKVWLKEFDRAFTPPLYLSYHSTAQDVCGYATDVHAWLFGSILKDEVASYAARIQQPALDAHSELSDASAVPGGTLGVFQGMHEWIVDRIGEHEPTIRLEIASSGYAYSGAAVGPVLNLYVSGAQPGAKLLVYGGSQKGSSLLPGCPNVESSIADPTGQAEIVANAGGFAGWMVAAPAGPALWQVADPAHCEFSNVVSFPDLAGGVLAATASPAIADRVFFGYSLAVLGDVDGDGRDDFAVGTPRGAGERGRVDAFSGKDPSLLWSAFGVEPGDFFGSSADCAGDVDADGLRDVVAGSGGLTIFSAGTYARVLSGHDGAVLLEVGDDAVGSNFAAAVSGAGDVDGDGYDDIVVGGHESHAIGNGFAVVHSGKTGAMLFRMKGAALIDRFGIAVDEGGDLDQDGFADLLVGAGQMPLGPGSAIVISGKRALDFVEGSASKTIDMKELATLVSQKVVLRILVGEHLASGFGFAVGLAGDVNLDGKPDYVVGAPYFRPDGTGPKIGKATLFSGADGSAIRGWTGGAAFDRFGETVAGVGDFDGDGIPDIAVGAFQGPQNIVFLHQPLGTGYARVYSGANGSALASLNGSTYGAEFGRAIRGRFDGDGDGRTEVLIGAPHGEGYQLGAVTVHSFPSTNEAPPGIVTATGASPWVSLQDPKTLPSVPVPPAPSPVRLFSVAGAAKDFLGMAVSAAGDVDRDGYADVLVGAPYASGASGASGAARVVSGKNGAGLFTLLGKNAGDLFGRSVAPLGEVDADGYPDFAVGAPCADGGGLNSGAVVAFSGRDASAIWSVEGSAPGESLGQAVASAGDVNGDGVADTLVGIPFRDGAAGVDSGACAAFDGRNGALLFELQGQAPSEFFGFAVAGIGDVDQDGRGDIAIGAYGADGAGVDRGALRVFSGRDGALLWQAQGDSDLEYFGISVSGLGDANGDGIPDLIAGSYSLGKLGHARVHSGANGAVLHDLNGAGFSGNDHFGLSVAGVGDADGDGRGDFAVGSPYADKNGFYSGSVQLFSGSSGKALGLWSGDGDFAMAGFAVAGAGDLDGDGKPDLVVGIPFGHHGGPFSGAAVALSKLFKPR